MTSLPALLEGKERRSRHPLAQLSRQLNDACIHAVQPLELAAILEAEGLTDALVQERYGQPNIFACAERLYQMVPYRAPTTSALRPTQRSVPWHDLLRGVTYLLPALWTPYALAVGSAGDIYQGSSLGLLVASLFGWSWMQGMAYLGYTGLSASRSEAAFRLRRSGLGTVLLSALLAMGIAVWQGQDVGLVVLAAVSISAYLAAATTLLVLGEEVKLLFASLPALAGSLLLMLFPDLAQREHDLHVVLLALAVGLPVVEAYQKTRPISSHGLRLIRYVPHAALSSLHPKPSFFLPLLPFGRLSYSRPDQSEFSSLRRRSAIPWRNALPHAIYGGLCAAFMSLVLLTPFAGQTPAHSAVSGLLGFSWSLAPLVLSLGLMELKLRRIHAGLRQQACRTGDLEQIIRGALGEVAQASAAYFAILGLAYLVILGLTPTLGLTPPPLPLLLGHVVLGLALLLSSLLINFGLLSRVLLVWGLALTQQIALLLLGTEATLSYAISTVGAATLLALLSILAVRDVRNLT